ncbi:MAG: ArsR family transcriptional regulator [Halobacteriota archaeon]|nr:ArsR family transcriptional regulator [Halobacteriota archaeon]
MDDLCEATSRLLKVSGHKARIEILKSLNKSQKPARELAEQLGVSETYVHQHLNKLSEEDLITKEGKFFSLSTSGRIFFGSLDMMEVVGKYKRLWDSHSIEKIPPEYIKDMKVFRDTELINSAPKVIEKFYSVASYTDERLLIATDRVPMMQETAFNEMFKNEVQIYRLLGSIPYFQSMRSDLKLPQGLEVRIAPMDRIYLGILIIDNKEAGVIFPDNKGLLDWNNMVCGKDPEFISWVEKNFWDMFKRAEDIRKQKS